MTSANKSLENFVLNQKIKFIYTHEFTCQFFDQSKTRSLQRSEMFSWNKIINALKRSRGNINPFTTFKPSGSIGSYVSCAFIEIWSTWEVWRALKKLELLSTTPRATLTHLSCSPNFPRDSYLDERTLTYEPIVKCTLETDVKWSILRGCIFLRQFLRIFPVSNNNVFAIHNWKGPPAHSSLKLKSKLNVIIHPEESIPSWFVRPMKGR